MKNVFSLDVRFSRTAKNCLTYVFHKYDKHLEETLTDSNLLDILISTSSCFRSLTGNIGVFEMRRQMLFIEHVEVSRKKLGITCIHFNHVFTHIDL